jgi:hypothetical protein
MEIRWAGYVARLGETRRRAVIAQSYSAGYGLDDWVSRDRFPAGAGNFSLHYRVQNGSGAHLASYPMGTKGSFPGGKAAGSVKLTTHLHLVPRSKNEWNCTSTPTRLHGVVLS